jgi:hypothetical protein
MASYAVLVVGMSLSAAFNHDEVSAYQAAKIAVIALLVRGDVASGAVSVLAASGDRHAMGNDRASYLIMDEKLSSVFEKAGIPVRSQGEDRFISVYLRYGVGEVRLLCREKYDFQDALQPKNRRAGVRSSSVGGACVAVLAPDVREFKDALVCGRNSIYSP